MIQRHSIKLAPVIGLALTFAIAPMATADLSGVNFNMVSEYTGSPYWDGATWIDYGGFVVGNGAEWTGPVENVYDFTNNGSIVGWIQHSFDVGDDYIEMTTTWANLVVDNEWSFLSLLPGDFYGYHITWDGSVDIASASLSVTGNPVNMGDLDLYEDINPGLEAWVDSYIVDPESGDRITITPNGLDINMQGIAWEYWNVAGVAYSQTSRIEFTFVPAPGALVLLGIAGLCRRRRS
jgi:hypothetical protein